MTDTIKTAMIEAEVAKTNTVKAIEAKLATVKAPVVKVKAKKANKGQRRVVKAPVAYSWSVKGPKSTPTQLLTIDGKERSFELGSTQKLKVGQFKATEPQVALFDGLLAQIKAVPAALALSCKAGYKGAQFGLCKANLSNAWSGFLTVTDGELCCHAWPQRGISKDTLLSLAKTNGIKPNRQGPNWFTVSDGYLSPKYIAKAKKFCLAVVKLAKG